jgi:hypothetical protein
MVFDNMMLLLSAQASRVCRLQKLLPEMDGKLLSLKDILSAEAVLITDVLLLKPWPQAQRLSTT